MAALTVVFVWCLDRLTQDVKDGFVSGKAQHDKVSIGAMNTMARVRIEAFLGALRSDEIENLVLALSRHERV